MNCSHAIFRLGSYLLHLPYLIQTHCTVNATPYTMYWIINGVPINFERVACSIENQLHASTHQTFGIIWGSCWQDGFTNGQGQDSAYMLLISDSNHTCILVRACYFANIEVLKLKQEQAEQLIVNGNSWRVMKLLTHIHSSEFLQWGMISVEQ